MTCFLASLAMGPISPLLPLAGLAYFLLMWTFWRYTVRGPVRIEWTGVALSSTKSRLDGRVLHLLSFSSGCGCVQVAALSQKTLLQ